MEEIFSYLQNINIDDLRHSYQLFDILKKISQYEDLIFRRDNFHEKMKKIIEKCSEKQLMKIFYNLHLKNIRKHRGGCELYILLIERLGEEYGNSKWLEEIDEEILNNFFSIFINGNSGIILRKIFYFLHKFNQQEIMQKIKKNYEKIKLEIFNIEIVFSDEGEEYIKKRIQVMKTLPFYYKYIDHNVNAIFEFFKPALDNSAIFKNEIMSRFYENFLELLYEREYNLILEKLKDDFFELATDRIGNFFIQKFIFFSYKNYKKFYRLLENDLKFFDEKSNVIYNLILSSCKNNDYKFAHELIMNFYTDFFSFGFSSRKFYLIIEQLFTAPKKYNCDIFRKFLKHYRDEWLAYETEQKYILLFLKSGCDLEFKDRLIAKIMRNLFSLCKNKEGRKILHKISDYAPNKIQRKIEQALSKY